jgi:hypothetical protein
MRTPAGVQKTGDRRTSGSPGVQGQLGSPKKVRNSFLSTEKFFLVGGVTELFCRELLICFTVNMRAYSKVIPHNFSSHNRNRYWIGTKTFTVLEFYFVILLDCQHNQNTSAIYALMPHHTGSFMSLSQF